MNTQVPHQRGFIALISILILSALMTAVALGMSERSQASSREGIDSEVGLEATTMAENCAEHALLRFKLDATYMGDEILSIGGNTCKIYPFEADGSGGKLMKTESTVSLYAKRILIEARRTGTNTELISWQNVAHF